jgi:hypothetical protein
MDRSGNDRCPQTDFQGKAEIPKTHGGIALVKRLNLLQRIQIPLDISNMCFLWHDWLKLKISHLDFLSFKLCKLTVNTMYFCSYWFTSANRKMPINALKSSHYLRQLWGITPVEHSFTHFTIYEPDQPTKAS